MSQKKSNFDPFFMQFCSFTWAAQRQSPDAILDSPIEDLRHVYLMHPCTNKEMVQRIFNDFVAIIGPKQIGQLESEEAEVSPMENTSFLDIVLIT